MTACQGQDSLAQPWVPEQRVKAERVCHPHPMETLPATISCDTAQQCPENSPNQGLASLQSWEEPKKIQTALGWV